MGGGGRGSSLLLLMGLRPDRLGTKGLRPGQAQMPTPGRAERKRRGPQEEGAGRGKG